MNKHCFRLIFSKSLGFLIPVAETARSQRKPGQTAGPTATALTQPVLAFRRLALSVLLAALPAWAVAEILVDPKNPSGTGVINAANGVPVIEISNPNSNGLSHNRFTEFDVQKPGVIFNNSLVNGQSQLGGAVLRNPNLQRTATAILSEVTGNKPSSISGTLEVFGAPADLLVANPNGVTVNGVTTLNTSSLTLSTGHVKNPNGSLQFLVDEKSGQVVVGADGVNTAGLSFFDIVARSVALQGKLGSDALQTDLQITTGQGTYDPATGTFTAKPGAQGSGLAVSGDAAGAMHGRFITLISTDRGAGVRQDGFILAAKDIAISADGDIQLNNTTTKTQVQIASTASFTNAGTLEANTTQVKAQNVLNQNGATLGGTEALNIEATKSVSNSGGKLIGKTVSVKADTISNTNKGQILGTDITLNAETAFTHDGNASIVAAKDLSIDTTKFTANTGELLAGNSLTLAADSYQNSATISSKSNASLTLKHGNDLVIDKTFKGPQAGGLLSLSARDVTITDELNNAGSVAINASRDVRNQGAVIVGKTLGITAKGLIDNRAGKLIWAGENLVLDAGTQLLNGENSQLLSMGDMSLSAGEKVQNNVGRIEAQKNLWIDTPLLENLSQSTGGLKQIKVAEEDHYFGDSYGTFDWTQYFRTRISLPVFASDLTVKQAVIKAGGDLQLNADKAKGAIAKVRNVGGLIAATGDVQVKGDLENLGLSTTRTLVEALKNSQTMTRWTSNDDLVKDESPTYGTLYELLERTYGGPSNTGWTSSLQLVNTPEVNQLLSAVLGADWKALDRGSLQARWRDFKFSNKTQPYYADQQAEISAGNAFVHTDGTFANGDGTNAGAQRPITIKVGSETVQSLDGELDAQFNLKRTDAEKALSDLLGNPLFQKSQSGDAFGRIKPLYETRAKYLDQSQFLGSDYFLQKIGYDPHKTVSVLGDAYFDNQLILQSVEQRVGNFFAQTQRVSGTDLAKQLLDNGAALALKEGLTLGQPLSGAQITGLEKDVVWYENREVDGQMVLAPRVYLSQKTLAARDKDANSAALVSADVVLIDANTVNNINGTVRGNTDTFVYSKTDINNVSKGGAQAGFFAGESGKNAGQLVIAAEGKVNNQGGVMSGFEQTVVGGKGISSSATTGYDKNGSLVVRDNGILGTELSADKPADAAKPVAITEQTTLAEAPKPAEKGPLQVAKPDVRAIFNERLAAGPVDTTQGSSLNVISGGDIDLTGAITQSDNVSLQTSGNLNLNDLHEARSAFDSASRGGFLSSVHIQEKAASANSVGNTLNAKNLQINTQGNLNITGGEINAQNSAIEVGGDSTIKAGKDLAFHEKTTKTTQLVFGGGAGAAGYEVTGSFGSAAKIDTHLGGAFAGTDGDGSVSLGGAPVGGSSPRGDVYAGRAAATQTLASNGTGARSGANKGRGGTSGANLKIGLETVTTTDTSESATYRNAQLNLGNGSVKVGGTLDIGGADINAGYQLSPEARAKMTADQRKAVTDGLPTLAISAGDIKTTKVENTEKTTHSRDELFIGVTSEVHSSAVDIATQAANLAYKALGTDVVKDPNAPAGSSKTLATEDRKMDVDPALTALAAVGMITQAAFGEVAGQSTTFGIKHTEQKSDSTTRSENINQLGGNISLTSTKGDIELNGVNLLGGKVGIKSAGNLTQRAAKSSTVSHDSTNTQSAGLTTSIGISPTGAGMGVSFGADGSGDKTTTTSTSYTNGLISGTEVSIETAGDHNLIGSNIKGNEVAVKVGGNQNITSVQDTSDMTHERNNWSASVGVAITTSGLVQGTGSASVSYGEDFDRSKLVAEQAGISGDKLDLNIAGNLNLTGAHITSQKGQGTVQVGGNINAQTLQDTREKDGGYGGGGGGISKNGLASVTLEFGRVDQVHYNATNAATIDVGDPTKVTAAKGISGPLNTNADSQLNVTQNKRVAGTDVKIEISPGDAQEIKGGVKKLLTRKTGGGTHIASGPSGIKAHDAPKQKNAPQPDATRAIPNVYAEAPKAKPSQGPSLASAVNDLLLQQGIKTEVKGYDTPIRVDEQGHKQPTQRGAVDALANGDPAEPNQPYNPKKKWIQNALKDQAADQGVELGGAPSSPATSGESAPQIASADPQPGTSKRSAQEADLGSPEQTAKKAARDESVNSLGQLASELQAKTKDLDRQVSVYRDQDAGLAQVAQELSQLGPYALESGVVPLPPTERPQQVDEQDEEQRLDLFINRPLDDAQNRTREVTQQWVNELREARQSDESKSKREQRNQARKQNYAKETVEQRVDRQLRQELYQGSDELDLELQREGLVEPGLSAAQRDALIGSIKTVDEIRQKKLLERQQTPRRPATPVVTDGAPPSAPAASKQVFDQHVIINTDTNNEVVTRSVERLAAKHADKSVVVKLNPDGTTTTLHGELKAGGRTKFEVVGHSDGNRLGDTDYTQIADVVQKLAADSQTDIGKVNLVGCGTRCATAGPAPVNQVSSDLLAGGHTDTWIKGYATPIGVNEQGRKHVVAADSADALGKSDPAQPPSTSGDGPAQRDQPVNPKRRWLQAAEKDQAREQAQAPEPLPAPKPPTSDSSTGGAIAPARTDAADLGAQSLLGKRSATKAQLDAAAGGDIQSMFANVQKQLADLQQMVFPAGDPPPQLPAETVAPGLLPTFLWDDPAASGPASTATLVGYQGADSARVVRAVSATKGHAWLDESRKKDVPIASVKGQQRSPEGAEQSRPTLPQFDQITPVNVVLTDTPSGPLQKTVITFGEEPSSKTLLDSRAPNDRPITKNMQKLGMLKGLVLDWAEQGGDILNTEDTIEYVRRQLPEKKSLGNIRKTLEIMQEVATGGVTNLSKAVDAHWSNPNRRFSQHPTIRQLAEQYGVSHASLVSAIDHRRPLYEVFHPKSGKGVGPIADPLLGRAPYKPKSQSELPGTASVSPATQNVRRNLPGQKDRSADEANGGLSNLLVSARAGHQAVEPDQMPGPAGAGEDQLSSAARVEARPPREKKPAPDNKKLVVDWIKSNRSLNDLDGIYRYLRVSGGTVSAANKTFEGLRKFYGEQPDAVSRATAEYFNLKKSGNVPDRIAVAKAYGISADELSMKLTRYQDYLEAMHVARSGNENAGSSAPLARLPDAGLQPGSTLSRTPVNAASARADVQATKAKLNLNQQAALGWLEQGRDLDDMEGMDRYALSQGARIASVTVLLRGFAEFLSKDPTPSMQAVAEHFQQKNDFKNTLLKPPTAEKLANKYELNRNSLNGLINRFRPYADALLARRAADEARDNPRTPSAPSADAIIGGSDVSSPPAGLQDYYVDVDNPSLIRLEPREDSTSPTPAHGSPGAKPIDVDSLADDGFRTHIKSEPQDSPEPPPANQPEYVDVTDMDVGDDTPWLKAEPGSPTVAGDVPSPVEPDAPVKAEPPVVRHTIDNRVPILQDDQGRDVLLDALQPLQKSKKSKVLSELVARQKLGLGFETKKLIHKQATEADGGVLQAKRDIQNGIDKTARELAVMSRDNLANYMESWMEVDESVPDKGRGVKATRNIPAFTVLAPYAGKLISGEVNISKEWNTLGMNVPNYLFATRSGTDAISAFGDKVGNISSLFNKGDTAADNNVAAFTLGKKMVYFMTDKPVKAGEPLQFDYGKDYDTTGWPGFPIQVSSSESSDESDSDATAK